MGTHVDKLQDHDRQPSFRDCVRDFAGRFYTVGVKETRALHSVIAHLKASAVNLHQPEESGRTNIAYLKLLVEPSQLRGWVENHYADNELMRLRHLNKCDRLQQLYYSIVIQGNKGRIPHATAVSSKHILAEGPDILNDAIKTCRNILEKRQEELKEIQVMGRYGYLKQVAAAMRMLEHDPKLAAKWERMNRRMVAAEVKQRMREGYSRKEAEETLADYHFSLPPDYEQALGDKQFAIQTLETTIEVLGKIKRDYVEVIINRGFGMDGRRR